MTFACFVAVNFPKRSDKVEACVFFLWRLRVARNRGEKLHERGSGGE
jgi:hypothetical protein